jgi:hypothetical protein
MNTSTQQVVEKYYQTWQGANANHFPLAKDFAFEGPLQSASSPAEFREMAAQFMPMIKEIKIVDAAHNEEKAFVLSEAVTNIPQLAGWLAMDYFVIKDGSIQYSRTIYDPRHLLEFMQSQSRKP